LLLLALALALSATPISSAVQARQLPKGNRAAPAATITFTLDEDTLTDPLGSTPQTVTSGGVTATLVGNGGNLSIDGDGISINDVGEFVTVTFDQSVRVTGYTIGFANGGVTGSIDFSTDGGDNSLAEPGITAGTYSQATPLEISVGETLTIDGNVNDNETSQIKELIVEEFTQATAIATKTSTTTAIFKREIIAKKKQQQ